MGQVRFILMSEVAGPDFAEALPRSMSGTTRLALLVCPLLASAYAPLGAPRPMHALRSTAHMTVTEPPADSRARSARGAIALLATAGAAGTATLTADKLWGGGGAEALCTLGGTIGACADVLSSQWATVYGLPLSALGALAYTSVGLLAAAPLLPPRAAADEAAAGLNDDALAAFAAVLATFSACLVLLLVTVIKQPCALCATSAALSLAIFACSRQAPLAREREETAAPGAAGAALALAVAAVLYAPQVAGLRASQLVDEAPAAATVQRPPPIASRSSARALAIAEKLAARNARMYGAYWCWHCSEQKETLGREAFAKLGYIECAPDGVDAQSATCRAEGVKGYPTWQIDGKLYPGEKDLDELAELLGE